MAESCLSLAAVSEALTGGGIGCVLRAPKANIRSSQPIHNAPWRKLCENAVKAQAVAWNGVAGGCGINSEAAIEALQLASLQNLNAGRNIWGTSISANLSA